MAVFPLRLEKTYYNKGFFNVTVDYDRYISSQDGPIEICLVTESFATTITGRIDRRANANGTPRIYGNKPLSDFFQRYYSQGDTVPVEIIRPDRLQIDASKMFKAAPKRQAQRQKISRSDDKVIEIESLYCHLDRFCKALFYNKKSVKESGNLTVLISELCDLGFIPPHEANMMHTIRKLRNTYVHEHISMGPNEIAIALGAWGIIKGWAESFEPEIWQQAMR